MNYCEFLRERDRFFYKLCKGIKLRLERENQVLIIQLSISNLFLTLFHQVDVMSTFSSVFLIHMEELLLKSVKNA